MDRIAQKAKWIGVALLFTTSCAFHTYAGPTQPGSFGAAAAQTGQPATVKATGVAPYVAFNLFQSSSLAQINPNGATLKDKIYVQIATASMSPVSSVNWVAELGINLVDSNGVIYPLSSLKGNSACYYGCIYTALVDTNSFKAANYTMYAYSKTLGGMASKTTEYSVRIANVVITPPSVSITTPADGAIVSKTTSVSYSAADNVGLLSVTILLDGAVVYSGKSSPASFTVDTLKLSNGNHTLSAVATNTNNLKTTSKIVNIVVNNLATLSPTPVPNPNGQSPALLISDTNPTSSVYISQSGNNILTSGDGKTWSTNVGPFSSVVYKGNAGTHSVAILNSVAIETLVYCAGGCSVSAQGSLRNTVVSIDAAVKHGATSISGNAKTSAWVMANDQVSGVPSNRLHIVSQLAPPTEPSDLNYYGAAVDRSNLSLWGSNPNMNDINQGYVGDCYFLAPLASIAGGNIPNVNKPAGNSDALRELAVELPSGNILTQWKSKTSGGQYSYIQVTKKFSNSYVTNSPKSVWGSTGVWGAALEKAFALYRSGQNSYSSINGGTIREAAQAFGFTETWDYNNRQGNNWQNGVNYSILTQDQFRSTMNNAVGNRQIALLGSNTATFPSSNPLYVAQTSPVIGGHAYTYLWVRNTGGQNIYTVRNPWGYDPSGGVGAGVVELTESQFLAGFGYEDRSLNIP